MSKSNPPSHMRHARPLLRVLLVDDDLHMLRALRRALSVARPNWQVTIHCEPAKALFHLEHEAVDVLISDYEMPLMNGLDLLRRVRRHHPTVLRVILSGKFVDQAESVPKGLVHAWIGKSHALSGLTELLDSEFAELKKSKTSSKAS